MDSRFRGNDVISPSFPRKRESILSHLAATLIAALVITTPTQAAPPKPDPVKDYGFGIVTAGDSALTRRIAEDLSRRLIPIFAGFRTELAQRRRTLYVAIGPAALREVASRRCDCVVVSAFTSSQVYRSIAGRPGASHAAAITAVYAEPAPSDQLRLAALLYRRPVRVAAILGPDTGFLRPLLEAEYVTVQGANGSEDINRILNQIGQTDALLALPDSTVFNPENIRNILLSTYRHKQGVIGFSGDMVKAGALATTYSEIEDINAQVAEIAAHYVAGGELAAPQFPRYFRTIVNEGVARSLEIEVPEEVRRFSRQPVPLAQPVQPAQPAPQP